MDIIKNKDDKILEAKLEDKILQCRRRSIITYTEFLDLRQRSIAQRLSEKLLAGSGEAEGYLFYGGYEDAERVIEIFLPEYLYGAAPEELLLSDPESVPVTVLRVKLKRSSAKLSHRDYLGSLMGLGIKREVTGDILVRDDGADIITMSNISDYIISNLYTVGHESVSIEGVSLNELIVPESAKREITDTVASLRLDSITASVFGLSRAKAADAINSGIVYLNNAECTKPEKILSEGDKIVLRGKGRAILKGTGGTSKKGRIRIILEVYR